LVQDPWGSGTVFSASWKSFLCDASVDAIIKEHHSSDSRNRMYMLGLLFDCSMCLDVYTLISWHCQWFYP
jgi:hypothetical protein